MRGMAVFLQYWLTHVQCTPVTCYVFYSQKVALILQTWNFMLSKRNYLNTKYDLVNKCEKADDHSYMIGQINSELKPISNPEYSILHTLINQSC